MVPAAAFKSKFVGIEKSSPALIPAYKAPMKSDSAGIGVSSDEISKLQRLIACDCVELLLVRVSWHFNFSIKISAGIFRFALTRERIVVPELRNHSVV